MFIDFQVLVWATAAADAAAVIHVAAAAVERGP
jgi:hypothetical protein